MKKFLAMVMALCMVCMTVVVASAAEPTSSVSGIRGATVDNDGRHVEEAKNLTPEQKNDLRTKAGVGSYDQILYGKLKDLTGDKDATIHLKETPNRLRDTKAYYLDAGGNWQEATCSRNGNDVTFRFPADRPFSIVQYCNAPSSGASTGAEVKAPQTNDASVELMLAAGMLLFGTVAVVAKKRHAA